MAVDFNLPILVVHNNATQRAITKRFMNGLGFNSVENASGSRSALEMMNKKRYGLVIAAWEMDIAEGDGRYLLERMQGGDEALRSIPLVMIFGRSDSKVISGAIDLGMKSYVTYPFDQSSLKKALVRVLGEF